MAHLLRVFNKVHLKPKGFNITCSHRLDHIFGTPNFHIFLEKLRFSQLRISRKMHSYPFEYRVGRSWNSSDISVILKLETNPVEWLVFPISWQVEPSALIVTDHNMDVHNISASTLCFFLINVCSYSRIVLWRHSPSMFPAHTFRASISFLAILLYPSLVLFIQSVWGADYQFGGLRLAPILCVDVGCFNFHLSLIYRSHQHMQPLHVHF